MARRAPTTVTRRTTSRARGAAAASAVPDEELAAITPLAPVTAELADDTEEPGKRRVNLAFLAPSSPVPVITGILVVAIGFVLIAIAWSRVAAQLNVALQMPYLVSAGITGLSLVMVGLLVINLSVKRQEAAERRQQMEQLAEILEDLKRQL